MSLADELLADLEDGGDEELMDPEVDERSREEIGSVDDVMMQPADVNINSIHSLAKLRDSQQVGI